MRVNNFMGFETTNGESYACNERGAGLFVQTKSGDWKQLEGTCDTPVFGDVDQLQTYVLGRYENEATFEPLEIARGSAFGCPSTRD